jgi:hypothetical protein
LEFLRNIYNSNSSPDDIDSLCIVNALVFPTSGVGRILSLELTQDSIEIAAR